MPSGPAYNTPAWRAVRMYVLNRDAWQCKVNGPRCAGGASEADHVVAVADGGAMYDPANLRASCKRCNGRRAAMRTNALRRGRSTSAELDVRL